MAIFLAFFFAYNRGTYLALGLLTQGTQDVSLRIQDLARVGFPFLGGFQLDSDALIVGRLQASVSRGIFADWPFLVTWNTGTTYDSQLGLGGWLLSLAPSVLRQDSLVGIAFMYCLVAGLSAACATGVLIVVHRHSSRVLTLAVAIALLQPWIVAIAGSIYWIVALKILPAVLTWWGMRQQRTSTRWLGVGVFAASFLAFASGYEYATVVVALPLSVAAYFIVRYEVSRRVAARYMLAIGGSQLLAFCATLLVHILLLSRRAGDMASGYQALVVVVTRRTGATQQGVDSINNASLSASPMDVLSTYLSMPVFGAPFTIPVLGLVTVGVLIAVVLATLPLPSIRRSTHSGEAHRLGLSVAWIVSLLGPLGWILLARPHSYGHTHINFALWFLPTIPLAVLLLGSPVRVWVKTTREVRPLTWAIVLAAILLATATVVSYLTVR